MNKVVMAWKKDMIVCYDHVYDHGIRRRLEIYLEKNIEE